MNFWIFVVFSRLLLILSPINNFNTVYFYVDQGKLHEAKSRQGELRTWFVISFFDLFGFGFMRYVIVRAFGLILLMCIKSVHWVPATLELVVLLLFPIFLLLEIKKKDGENMENR